MCSKEIELKVGRESQPGTVQVSSFLSDLITLSVSYRGERAATVLLTREQVRKLREALAEIDSRSEREQVVLPQVSDLKLAA